MKMTNKKVLSTLLCGMPFVTLCGFDVFPFTVTCWVWSLKNTHIHPNISFIP